MLQQMNGDVWLLCLCFFFTELLLMFSIEHLEKQSCGTHGWESGMKRAFSFLSSVIEMKIPFLAVMAAKKLSACGALQAVQTERWHLGPWVAFQ